MKKSLKKIREKLGHWGRMKLMYMEDNQKQLLKEHLQDDTLLEYLLNIEKEVSEYKTNLMNAFKKKDLEKEGKVYSDMIYENMADEFAIKDIIES